MKLFSYHILTSRLEKKHNIRMFFWKPQNHQGSSKLPIWSSWATRESGQYWEPESYWAPVGKGWRVFYHATISDNNYPVGTKLSPREECGAVMRILSAGRIEREKLSERGRRTPSVCRFMLVSELCKLSESKPRKYLRKKTYLVSCMCELGGWRIHLNLLQKK